MKLLEDIAELPPEAIELLEAVGYLDAEDLTGADAAELQQELEKANTQLRLMATAPSQDDVKQWQELCQNAPQPAEQEVVEEAESVDADEAAEEEAPEYVNFENDPEVLEMLSTAPEAEVLPVALIKRHKIAVGEIPEGILLTECERELDINVMTTDRASKAQRREIDSKRTGLMVSRIRDFDAAASDDHHVKPLAKGEAKEVNSVSEGLNAGVSPNSRRFVRGVMHPSPWSVRVSAFFAILVQLFLVAAFLGIPWLLYHEYQSGDSMLWWVVGLGGGLVLSALCYLFWGLSARCRVCGQRQFAPKKCLKNKKAHHLPLIGYIFPTALHAIFYKWFYCTYCGTAVRLKK
ncbi:MAG: DUF4332 domain-containing protein [Akkermansiaceae bacterium]